jgi:hypothetical protein
MTIDHRRHRRRPSPPSTTSMTTITTIDDMIITIDDHRPSIIIINDHRSSIITIDDHRPPITIHRRSINLDQLHHQPQNFDLTTTKLVSNLDQLFQESSTS